MSQPKVICGLPNISRNPFTATLVSGDRVAMGLRTFSFQVEREGIDYKKADFIYKVSLKEVGPLPVPKTLEETCAALILLSAHRPAHGETKHPGEVNFHAFLKQLPTQTIRNVCIMWEIGFDPIKDCIWSDYAQKHQGNRKRLIDFLDRHVLGETLKKGLTYSKKYKIPPPKS